jgi:hypothetical protein
MSVINDSLRSLLSCLFISLAYDLLPYGSNPTSPLPQTGVFLVAFCLCGAAIAIPFLAFVSFVIGSIVYAIRKRTVDSEMAKFQAIVGATLSFALLVIASFALVAYWFRDLYIP